MRRRRILVLALGLAAGSLHALENEDLKRYGFSGRLAESVADSKRLEIPPPQGSTALPGPVSPGQLLDPREIPAAPEYVARVVRQRQEAPTPGVEGPVAPFPGEEHAAREEGTFKEVEDFFFRPRTLYQRTLSMNETGVTGLLTMPTAEIPRPGASFARVGMGYTFYNRFSGTQLVDGAGIEQFTAPVTYQTVPWRNLELSLQVMGVSEEADGFPLVPDYQVNGIREVGVNAKYRFFDNPANQTQVALGFGMKVGVDRTPTRLGSNAVDYNFFLAATRRRQNFGAHVWGGFTFPNGETRSNSGVPDIAQLGLGLDFSPSDRLSINGELNYTDWNFVGTNLEAALGIKFKMSDRWIVDFGVPIQVDNELAEGYRYRVLLGVQAQL